MLDVSIDKKGFITQKTAFLSNFTRFMMYSLLPSFSIFPHTFYFIFPKQPSANRKTCGGLWRIYMKVTHSIYHLRVNGMDISEGALRVCVLRTVTETFNTFITEFTQ